MPRTGPGERHIPQLMLFRGGSGLTVEDAPLVPHDRDTVMDPGRIWIGPRLCPGAGRRVGVLTRGKKAKPPADGIPCAIPPSIVTVWRRHLGRNLDCRRLRLNCRSSSMLPLYPLCRFGLCLQCLKMLDK